MHEFVNKTMNEYYIVTPINRHCYGRSCILNSACIEHERTSIEYNIAES